MNKNKEQVLTNQETNIETNEDKSSLFRKTNTERQRERKKDE